MMLQRINKAANVNRNNIYTKQNAYFFIFYGEYSLIMPPPQYICFKNAFF